MSELTPQERAERKSVEMYNDGVIKEVTIDSDKDGSWVSYIEDETNSTLGIFIPDTNVEVGDRIRVYGEFGRPFRGIDINGREIFYRTPEEQAQYEREQNEKRQDEKKQDFERNRTRLDDDYDALPDVFKARIDRFRKGNPHFRWQYESYEMMCCKEALLIADTLKTADAIEEWRNLNTEEGGYDHEEMERQVPISPDHSGNSIGMAIVLAKLYVTTPDLVVWMHGALTPLVGCEEYGCTPHATTAMLAQMGVIGDG